MYPEEIIEQFHEYMKNQILIEYQKDRKVTSKLVILLLNPENKPVLRIKKHTFNQETELNEEVRERLSKYINEFREIWISDRNELIDHLTGDGYEHIAEFLIEFTENDGILHTQMTKI